MVKTIDRAEFIRVWPDLTVRQLAARFGTTENTCRVLACQLRAAGHRLERKYRGGRPKKRARKPVRLTERWAVEIYERIGG